LRRSKRQQAYAPIEEAADRLRADVCDGLAFLGVDQVRAMRDLSLDDVVVSDAGPVAVLVVHAREDVEIARQV
jgi:acetate kinase